MESGKKKGSGSEVGDWSPELGHFSCLIGFFCLRSLPFVLLLLLSSLAVPFFSLPFLFFFVFPLESGVSVWGLGSGVWGLVWGLESGVWGLRCPLSAVCCCLLSAVQSSFFACLSLPFPFFLSFLSLPLPFLSFSWGWGLGSVWGLGSGVWGLAGDPPALALADETPASLNSGSAISYSCSIDDECLDWSESAIVGPVCVFYA